MDFKSCYLFSVFRIEDADGIVGGMETLICMALSMYELPELNQGNAMETRVSFHKTEVVKGLVVGLVTMLMSLFIWELSLSHNNVKRMFQMRHPLEPEQIKYALKRYFQDHADNAWAGNAGVSLQTLEDEGYLSPHTLIDVHPVQMQFHKSILAPSETPSGQVCVEARLPSGERLVVLDDGSEQDANQLAH